MDDEEICRVCRSESTPDHQLYHPCKCSGSIRFVHEDCLIEWLSHSKKKYCELCEYPFTFSPIYRDDMPEKVPLFVLFSQLLRRLASLIKTVVRGLTVVIVWLIILPNFTLWTWRFYFWSGETIIGFNNSGNQNATTAITTTAETLTPVTTQPTSYLTFETLKSFLSDCVEGQIITAFVVIIFVAAYLFREWVLQNLPAEQAPLNDENPIIENANQNNNNNEQLVQEQVAIDTLLNAMQVINPINQNNEQVDNYMDRIGHRLEDIRNELQNELARNNNNNEPETFEWSSYIQDRNLDESNDQLFGGLDGMGSSSSQHNQQHLDNANDDDNEYVGWPASESSRRRMDDDDDYEEDEDEEEEEEEEEGEDRLPELVDPARMNNVAIQRILDQHLNPNLREIRQIPIVQPPQPAAAAEEEEPFDVGDDINGVLEAIGMRGNPWMLVQNSVLMSLMISLCLGIAVWVPYVIGRLVILIRPISFIETPIYVMRLVTDPLVDFVLDLCVPYTWSLVLSIVPQNIQLAMESLQEQFSQIVEGILSSAVSMSNETIVVVEEPTNTAATTTLGMVDNMLNNIDWELVQSKVESVGTAALARWHQFATGRTGLDRSMCIVVGYLVLIAVGSWYLTHSRRRANSGRPSSATGDTIQDIIRQQGIFLKVLFFILIELVVFPTVCGFLLDMATLPLFVNASFSSRYAFHLKSPYSSHFLHWFLGTGVLFYFAIFITVCREIIRPGVMWFIRDPNDPQFHPVQEMVEKPLPTLLQKISQSALIYSGMLVFGVGTVTYSLAYTGVVFPLRLPFNAPLSTLAIDLLIIQFLLPPLIAFIKPRDYSKKALDLWWHFACRQLRLTSFMFNVRKPDEEGRHIRRTLKAMLLFQKAEVPTDTFSDVDIEDDHSPVVFKRDGMMIRVPKYDSVPVDPTRRMLVPVDPVTLEPIDDEERRRGHPATADTNDEAQSTIVVYIPPNFKRRIIIFLYFMWFSISLFTCSVTVVPLLVGRALFKTYLAPGSKVNDLYSFALGIYIMAGLGTVIHWITECYATYKANEYHNEIMTYMKEKAKMIAKFIYFSIAFGVVIPLLFGIAVDLFVFMPIRSFNSESGLVIYVSQNWSFGVAYMSIIHNIIHVLPANNNVRQKLNTIIGDGIMQTDVWHITKTVIIPVILIALLAINVPALTSWGILQMLDSKDPSLQVTVTIYTYPIIFCFFIAILSIFLFKNLIHLWIQIVRDDIYLIGKRLHNMKNQSENSNNESTSTIIENGVAH